MLRVVVALLIVASLARAEPDGVRWRRESWGQRGRPVLAVALDDRTGEVAFGDELGASRAVAGSPGRRVARTAAVTDLVFDREGALWIATRNGLWQHARGAPVAADRSPAPGEAARHVYRLAAAGSALAVASEAGAFVSIEGSPWARVGRGAASGSARAVALRWRSAERCDLWWLAAASLWRGELERVGATARVSRVRQQFVTGAPVGVAPLDILVGSAVAEVVLLYPRAIALQADADTGNAWSIWRPVMPPGAVVRRIGSALGRLWLSTDRGLLQAEDPRLGWRRAGQPAGWLATASAAGDGQRLFSATATGVLRGELGESAPSRSGPAPFAGQPAPPRALARVEPGVDRVQAMALAQQGLGVARQRHLRASADRRSWWPELALKVAYGGDRSTRLDFDQSFVSGAARQLFDRDLGRGDDWDAALTLSWDLAAAVFDPQVIDLAREERAWIALRDEVLEEVNLLYFERRGALLYLGRARDPSSREAAELRLRVGELAAGLDAWTGGSFSRALTHPDRQQE